MKIGVMFGSPKTTSGGEAVKFYASMRIEFKQRGIISEGGDKNKEDIGTNIEIKFVKNKCAIPLKKAWLLNTFGKGFSKEKSLLNSALNYDIIQKNGSWYSRGEYKLGQGEQNILNYLENNKKIYNELYSLILDKFKETEVVKKTDEDIIPERIAEEK
jgi:recombination protein RecA